MKARLTLLAISLPALLAVSSFPQQPPQPATQKSDVQAHAEALMEQARHLSDIRSKGAPAFRLKATFSFIGKDLDTVEGTYSEVWVSSSQWWRETVVNNSRRVEVGGLNRRWLLDNASDFPEIARRLSDLVNIFPSTTIKFDFGSLDEHSTAGNIAICAITKPNRMGNKYAFCFDDQSGALLEKASPEVRPRNTTTFSCVYGVFRKFGDFQFPREVSCFEDKHRKIDAKIVELALEPAPDAELFKPPPGAIEHVDCSRKWAPPIPKFNPGPNFLSGEQGRSGIVTVLVDLDKDGKLQNVRVSQSAGKMFDEQAIATVGRWKFKPSTCDGAPVPAEIAVQIAFQGSY